MSSTSTPTPPSLLSLPPELRNQIYSHVFDQPFSTTPHFPRTPDALAAALKLGDYNLPLSACSVLTTVYESPSVRLSPLLICKRIRAEAQLLALSSTPFHLSGESAYPDVFAQLVRPLSNAQIGSLRHLTLTARISHLRALNEAWANLPFGCPSLRLDTLVIVPRRADARCSAYAEVADLSQSHTLAYIFSETLKSLRNVRVIEVRNAGCFNQTIWELVYRNLVYRLWRWGGDDCGLRVEMHWHGGGGFRVWTGEGEGCERLEGGVDVGVEVRRLAGVEDAELEELVPPVVVGP